MSEDGHHNEHDKGMFNNLAGYAAGAGHYPPSMVGDTLLKEDTHLVDIRHPAMDTLRHPGGGYPPQGYPPAGYPGQSTSHNSGAVAANAYGVHQLTSHSHGGHHVSHGAHNMMGPMGHYGGGKYKHGKHGGGKFKHGKHGKFDKHKGKHSGYISYYIKI